MKKRFTYLQKMIVRFKNIIFYIDRKTLVFDLDETLIHCNENSSIKSDVVLSIKFP